jgi:hypothetical protein
MLSWIHLSALPERPNISKLLKRFAGVAGSYTRLKQDVNETTPVSLFAIVPIFLF